MASGIYAIENLINGKIYIGSAANLSVRKSLHFGDLKKGKHHSIKLQRAYNKYGHDALAMRTLFECEKSELIFFEQRAIDAFEAVRCGYNVAPRAGSQLGLKHSELAIQKNREAHTGKKHTEETKKKIGAIHKGRIVSDETRKRQSDALTGRKMPSPTEETRVKISKAHKGRKHTVEAVEAYRAAAFARATPEYRAAQAERTKVQWTPERKAAQSAKRKGCVVSEATREKIRLAAKAQWADPIKRDKCVASRSHYSDPEWIAEQSARTKEQWADPKFRELRSKSAKAQWAKLKGIQ